MEVSLPFGLRLAPKIFLAAADTLLWSMAQQGVQDAVHYLDDFVFVGPPGTDSCTAAVSIAIDTCHSLGVPVALEKLDLQFF